MDWANDHDASLEKVMAVQGSLPVRLIMVPRYKIEDGSRIAHIATCRADETAHQIHERNKQSRFSYLPVVDEAGQISGLYRAERWFKKDKAPNRPILHDYEKLAERHLIGADADILHFVGQADKQPIKLAVAGGEIAGLVSQSDLQQLPVRSALFALLTSFEMVLAMSIAQKWPNDIHAWLDMIPENERKSVFKRIKSASQSNNSIGAIPATLFSHKVKIARNGNIGGISNHEHAKDLSKIVSLRNNLMHGNKYANTPKQAENVSRLVRAILALKRHMLGYLNG
jgi:CBS domain-containing protein